MLDHASSGEILVSQVTAGLVHDTGITLIDRGEVELRGISGPRHVYVVE